MHWRTREKTRIFLSHEAFFSYIASELVYGSWFFGFLFLLSIKNVVFDALIALSIKRLPVKKYFEMTQPRSGSLSCFILIYIKLFKFLNIFWCFFLFEFYFFSFHFFGNEINSVSGWTRINLHCRTQRALGGVGQLDQPLTPDWLMNK